MDEELNVTAAQPGGTPATAAGEQKVQAARLDSVTANTITMTDTQVNQLQAVDVQMSGGGAGRVQAANIQVTEGGIGMAQGQAVGVSNGGVGFMVAREVTVTDGSVGFMAALRLDGNPKIGFDMRAGAIMGLVFGIVVGLFRLLGNRRKCCE
jgi:hypothetical protein